MAGRGEAQPMTWGEWLDLHKWHAAAAAACGVLVGAMFYTGTHGMRRRVERVEAERDRERQRVRELAGRLRGEVEAGVVAAEHNARLSISVRELREEVKRQEAVVQEHVRDGEQVRAALRARERDVDKWKAAHASATKELADAASQQQHIAKELRDKNSELMHARSQLRDARLETRTFSNALRQANERQRVFRYVVGKCAPDLAARLARLDERAAAQDAAAPAYVGEPAPQEVHRILELLPPRS